MGSVTAYVERVLRLPPDSDEDPLMNQVRTAMRSNGFSAREADKLAAIAKGETIEERVRDALANVEKLKAGDL